MGESQDEVAGTKWQVRGAGAAGEAGRQAGDGRRSRVRPADVMDVLALVVGVVLGVGTWRTYVAENTGENGETGEDQGRALVKPKETIKPVEVAAGTSAYRAGARRPAGTRRRTTPFRESAACH